MKHSRRRKNTFSLAIKYIRVLINTTYEDLRLDYFIWTRLKFTSDRQFARKTNGRANTLRQRTTTVTYLKSKPLKGHRTIFK